MTHLLLVYINLIEMHAEDTRQSVEAQDPEPARSPDTIMTMIMVVDGDGNDQGDGN